MKTTRKEHHRFCPTEAWFGFVGAESLSLNFRVIEDASEQAIEATAEDNGIGFTGTDGNFLSSPAKQYIDRGYLSEKQMVFVFKKNAQVSFSSGRYE